MSRMKKRFGALTLAAVMLCTALSMPASADVPDDIKNSLAQAKITQQLNGGVTENGVHNLDTNEDPRIKYKASLQMTDEMAIYLQQRQKNLMQASFVSKVKMNLDLLEFTGPDTVTVYFESTFLKPKNTADITWSLVSYDPANKRFRFKIQAAKTWIQSQYAASGDGSVAIPMELIVYYDGNKVCSYPEAKSASLGAQQELYADFSVADWKQEATLDFAELKLKPGVAAAITEDAATWKTVTASGTVTGEFSYVTTEVSTIQDLIDAELKPSCVKRLKFGNDADIEGWTSNVVRTTLRRRTNPGGGDSGGDGPSGLNTEDHYSYIVGYEDGTVRPEGALTRAEAATIFFRLLTDETRAQYWSTSSRYHDVSSNMWFNNAVSTLSNMGIIDGFEDGSFRPNGRITRAQFAKIAVGFFESTAEEYHGYFDDVSPESWYAACVEAAVRNGLINGFEDGTFRPNSNITRAQACTIVNRTLGHCPIEKNLLPREEMICWPDNHPGAWYYVAMQEATNSHDYVMRTETQDGVSKQVEVWTGRLPQRDWAALERSWADAYSGR